FQTPANYQEGLAQLKNLLRGNLSPVIKHYKNEMKTLAEGLEFEKAALVKKKIEFLENYQSRSVVANTRTGNVDVFTIQKVSLPDRQQKDIACFNYLMVRNGSIIQTHTGKVETHLDETPEEILLYAIARVRTTFNSDATEIVVPFPIDYPQQNTTVTVPKGGDRKKLLELSEKNVNHFIEEIKNKERLQLNVKGKEKMPLLEQLQANLQLQDLPVHIECFDNSNFQGSYPVSAMVCFKYGEPSKKDYRHFNVKTVEGINDFATMKEAVYRRYKRLKEENQPFPQLVIIDGGKGQLGAALEAANELGLTSSITFVGLAKNVEEIFFAGDTESLKLPYNNESLKLIRRIRDEVHRFGISFHRQKRSKGTFKNELEEIKGIGKATTDLLLKEFKSVKKIKEASTEKLEKLVGKVKADVISRHFTKQRDT
ncbi:MAG TPA: excinuclease ABC subunit C, partial [Chitinophagaceae bacterium]|nr:excinuclease ABC subunit C [Chitinophagaceae bacterium]